MRIPKEHGAWAMLYVPFVLGVVVAAARGGLQLVPVLVLFVAVTGLFVGRESLVVWWRARRRRQDDGGAGRHAALLLGAAAAAAVVLVGPYGLLALVPLGTAAVVLFALHLVQVGRREVRTFAGELLGIVAMALAAPAAYLAGRGSWDATGAWLWALSGLYFTSSVFYVKLRVVSLQPRKQAERRALRAASAAYHGALLVLLALLAAGAHVHGLLLLAFAPILARAGWSVLRAPGPVNLRQTGVLEIAYSLNFLAWAAAAFGAA